MSAPPPVAAESAASEPAVAASSPPRPDDGRASAPKATSGRLSPLDQMRGIVMLLMTLDHARAYVYAGRAVTDSAIPAMAGPLPPAPVFLTRLVTHLCAPSFVFLAGCSLALSIARRRHRGESERRIDSDVALRGAIVLLLDPLLVSRFWSLSLTGPVVLQILYAIGAGFLLMVPLRRLPGWTPLALGLALGVFSEALAQPFWRADTNAPSPWLALSLGVGLYPGWMVLYPALPWLAMLLIGFGFGRQILATPNGPSRAARALALGGAAALALALLVRALGGYGNMHLQRASSSALEWLHVSKYPPSLAFTALTLGVMALLLAGLFWAARFASGRRSDGPLLVFGQVPLFFYFLHLPVLGLGARAAGLERQGGLVEVYLATAAALVLLYVPCRAYRDYKRAHPDSWARFV